jgi:hypothetical protein
VIGDAAQGHGGGDDPRAVFARAFVANREHDMRRAGRARDQDGAHRRALAQGLIDGDQARQLCRLVGPDDFVGAEGIVAWRRGLEGGRHDRLAGLVEHGDDAEVVALVIDEVKEFSQGLVRGQVAPTRVRSRMRVSTAMVARRFPSWLDTYSEICRASRTSWPSMASRKADWLTRIEE